MSKMKELFTVLTNKQERRLYLFLEKAERNLEVAHAICKQLAEANDDLMRTVNQHGRLPMTSTPLSHTRQARRAVAALCGYDHASKA